MKLVIDMNLSPDWVAIFEAQTWEAVHWSQTGDPRASDHEVMKWAQDHHCVVFTHDLDLGAILAVTQNESPSVVQVRAQDVDSKSLGPLIVTALKKHKETLEKGALVTIDESKSRVRLLPF